jgi:hypothetical protein
MEVMGLMLGEFVDEYTVRVIDVFAMPQSGTGVSVEAVDPVFQVTFDVRKKLVILRIVIIRNKKELISASCPTCVFEKKKPSLSFNVFKSLNIISILKIIRYLSSKVF